MAVIRLNPLIAGLNGADIPDPTTFLANLGGSGVGAWTNLTLLNGWTGLGGTSPPSARYQVVNNIVYIQGGLSAGTTATVCAVPSAVAPFYNIAANAWYVAAGVFTPALVALSLATGLECLQPSGSLIPSGDDVFFSFSYNLGH